jgi:hypothetical protein
LDILSYMNLIFSVFFNTHLCRVDQYHILVTSLMWKWYWRYIIWNYYWSQHYICSDTRKLLLELYLLCCCIFDWFILDRVCILFYIAEKVCALKIESG